MNYLVEQLSVCHEVLDSVMYTISVSDGSTFLNIIEAYRLMMEYSLLFIIICFSIHTC